MPGELESQLGQLLDRLPEPDPELGERVLARALAALPVSRPHPSRRLREVAVLLAATLVLLALAAAALAAAGALHVSFGQLSRHRQMTRSAAVPRLTVPRGASGVAAVVDGRLWLTTSGGLRLQGLPVSAAALSPHALYVAAGIGDSLVVLAPGGRRAWSRPTAGPVAAIAWAPDGLRIAYVVHAGRRFRLHVIEGNGREDRLIDRAARPVRPSWRADSLALAYAAAGGRPVVYDLGHRSRSLIASPAARDATRLAFAPAGRALAIGTRHGFLLTGAGARGDGFDVGSSLVTGLAWLHGELALAVAPARTGSRRPSVQLFGIEHGEAVPTGSLVAPGPVTALDAHDGRLTVAVTASGGVRVLSSVPGAPVQRVPLPRSGMVVELPAGSRIGSLDVR